MREFLGLWFFIFIKEEVVFIKGLQDFVGINYYILNYVIYNSFIGEII